MCDSVIRSGGEICIFSSKLYTGEKLDKLGGVAAILRFPLNLDYLDETLEEELLEEELPIEISDQTLSNQDFFDFC